MTVIACPHCGKPIDLVGQKELSEDYNLGPNPVAHARSNGQFPEPVLAFGNRNMWFREQIDEYVEGRSRDKISKLVEQFAQTIAALPEAEQKEARKMLESAGK